MGEFFFFPQIYWLINSQISKSFLKIILFLKKELMSIFGRLVLPGNIFIYIRIFFFNNFFAHLVPKGTPGFLIPVIVIIETVSNIIRPLTLSIRLAANIVAGHLLLTLLGSQISNVSFTTFLLLFFSLYLLLLLEVAVACIQSYVFIILNSLYLNELLRIKFNKTIIL